METVDARIEGLDLVFAAPGDAEQFEIECILIRLFAPGAAAGVGELAETLAGEIVKLAREVTLDTRIAVEGDDADAEPPTWDLARLAHIRDHLDTKDPALRRAWDAFCERLPKLAACMVASLTPEVTDRLDHVQVQRLFELTVLGHVHVYVDGKPSKITNYKLFRGLSKGRWRFKYQVLAAALAKLYLPTAEKPEPEPSEDA